jgi:branched-chain amino acid transport system substrate-binding protein
MNDRGLLREIPTVVKGGRIVRSKNLLIVALLLVAMAMSAFAMGTQEAAGDVIKVGWLGALTGDQAVWGNNEFNTVKMLFDEYNAKGGISVAGKMYKLQAIGYDSKGDAQEAVNVTKRLTGQDKVVAILGPNASGNAIPMAPILTQAKVPGIATVATNPKVTVLDGKVQPYNFRVCFIDPYQGAVAAGYAYDVLKARKAAILYDVSDDYSQGLREFFVENFRKSGGTIVADESFKGGDVDFRPQLSKIKAANPDIIFMPYFFKEVALSANQARELGMTQVMMGGDGWPSDQLISMGGAAVEGSYFVNHLDYDDPDVQDYKARYRAKFGVETELNGYLVHDAVLLLVAAIQKAGVVNGEAIAAAIPQVDVKGITGRIRINPNTHNPEGKDAAIIKIINGNYVFQQKYAAK